MAIEGYDFGKERFEELLLRKFFPEKSDHESKLLLEWLVDHHHDYDQVSFSVRVGNGMTIDDAIDRTVAANLERSSRRRIDCVAWQGPQATLVEMKTRVGHAVMGQLLSDALLWVKEFPNGPIPRLVALGRRTTDEDVEILTSHGIDVVIYETADGD